KKPPNKEIKQILDSFKTEKLNTLLLKNLLIYDKPLNKHTKKVVKKGSISNLIVRKWTKPLKDSYKFFEFEKILPNPAILTLNTYNEIVQVINETVPTNEEGENRRLLNIFHKDINECSICLDPFSSSENNTDNPSDFSSTNQKLLCILPCGHMSCLDCLY